jgi:predicted DCC family thiol-disulfide oxidoreductase YuxK
MAKPLLIYDDQCHFCGSLLSVIAALDKDHKIDCFGLNTDKGRKIRENLNLKPNESDTIVLITDRNQYVKSDAIFQSLRILGGFCKVFSYFRFTPRFIRDRIYDLIAQNRHRLSGKSSRQCHVRHDSRE